MNAIELVSAPLALTHLAQAFDRVASVTQGISRNRATKSAAQLRYIASRATSGAMTADEAWIWADAAAGQLQAGATQLRAVK